MATEKHPITGVELNVISIHRAALNDKEQLTAHILHLQNEDQHVIAHKLGINSGRVSETMKGNEGTELAEKAAKLLRENGELLL